MTQIIPAILNAPTQKSPTTPSPLPPALTRPKHNYIPPCCLPSSSRSKYTLTQRADTGFALRLDRPLGITHRVLLAHQMKAVSPASCLGPDENRYQFIFFCNIRTTFALCPGLQVISPKLAAAQASPLLLGPLRHPARAKSSGMGSSGMAVLLALEAMLRAVTRSEKRIFVLCCLFL